MSKLYNQYVRLKKENPENVYLFKSGLFYIFIGDDSIKMSNLLNLKCTKLTDDIYKCGFPVNSLEKYMARIQLLSINAIIIDQGQTIDYDKNYLEDTKIMELIRRLKKLDINEVTPLESLQILSDLKGVLDCD